MHSKNDVASLGLTKGGEGKSVPSSFSGQPAVPVSRPRILPVVSTKGGEGKSTQSANLAGFLADAGLRVLLIDGDHAQPTATSIFPLEYEAPCGLYELLMQTVDLSIPDNIISRSSIKNLDVIISNDPRNLLPTAMQNAADGRIRLRNALSHPLFCTYDVIIIDSQGSRSVMSELIILASTGEMIGVAKPILPDVREFLRGTVRLMEELLPYSAFGIRIPDLTFIEKAFGVHKARAIQEEQLGRSVTLRELEMLLNKEGYPVSFSSISRMEDTIKYLFPYLEELLVAGMSRGQIIPLLNLRTAAENTWSKFSVSTEPLYDFETVFGQTCQGFNSPDNYSLDMFRDEFIGQLLKALPHPSLNYDRWLIELDPKEQRRREQFGDPPPTPALTPVPERTPSRSRSEPQVLELPPDDTGVEAGVRP